jgi:hypothetical protein
VMLGETIVLGGGFLFVCFLIFVFWVLFRR